MNAKNRIDKLLATARGMARCAAKRPGGKN
jgi:hypothetical protein